MRALFFISSLWVFSAGVAAAETPLKRTACINAAAKAEDRHKIPDKLLQAITLVETGRSDGENIVAWPWTTNVDARGRYFESRSEVLRFIRNSIRNGDSSIDIGCFQINTKWHGANFAAIDDMLDPDAAADYAAQFLLALKEEFGDWNVAASKYHSRTPAFSNRYAQKLTTVQKTLLRDNAKRVVADHPLAIPSRLPVNDEILGGVALSIFLDAKPLIEPGVPRPLFQNAGLP